MNNSKILKDDKLRKWPYSVIIGLVCFLVVSYVLYYYYVDHYDSLNDSNLKIISHPRYGKIQCFANKDLVCSEILSGKVWEEGLFESGFKPFIEPDTVVIDCGSYIGSHTILFKKLNRNNLVLAFEMMPEHYAVLRKNIAMNELSDTLAFNVALGNQLTDIPLPQVDYEEANTHKNYGGTQLTFKSNPVHTPMVTLDYMIPWTKNKKVSFIKIDVEGHEIPVLEGGLKMIAMHKPIIAIEIWVEQMETFQTSNIWSILSQELRYQIIQISPIHDYLLFPVEKEDFVKQQLKP